MIEEKALGRRFELHTHTFFSDGVLSPMELVRRAYVGGCSVIALTDHVDFTNIEFVLKSQGKIRGEVDWDIKVLVGVELTHIPKGKIAKLALKAKKLGAEVVVLHGESPVEPVEEGTNSVGVRCSEVDILAHPGFIAVEDAERARENNVYLELTTRRGHSQANRHVAATALEAKARLLVNTDAHEPEDLITQKMAFEAVLDAGLDGSMALKVVRDYPPEFLKRLD